MARVTCPICGTKNISGAENCSYCRCNIQNSIKRLTQIELSPQITSKTEERISKHEKTEVALRRTVWVYCIISAVLFISAIVASLIFINSNYVRIGFVIVGLGSLLMAERINRKVVAEQNKKYQIAKNNIKQQIILEEIKRRNCIEEDADFSATFADALKLNGLDKKDNISGIIKILTKDYVIASFSDSDSLEAKSGWFGLYRKNSYFPDPEFVFSDLCTSVRGDRNEYDDICDFNSLEHNMIGLAAYLLPIRTKESPLFTTVQKKLYAVESDFEKQTIIQEAFGTQDWRNIFLKSPNNKITMQINVSPASTNSHEWILLILEGKVLPLFGDSYPHIYERLVEVAVEVLQGLSFIERYVLESPLEVKLGIIGIISRGRFHSKGIGTLEDRVKILGVVFSGSSEMDVSAGTHM